MLRDVFIICFDLLLEGGDGAPGLVCPLLAHAHVNLVAKGALGVPAERIFLIRDHSIDRLVLAICSSADCQFIRTIVIAMRILPLYRKPLRQDPLGCHVADFLA